MRDRENLLSIHLSAQLFGGLKDLAENQIEIGKNKFLKTDADINPNQKFINNCALLKLEENPERLFLQGSTSS